MINETNLVKYVVKDWVKKIVELIIVYFLIFFNFWWFFFLGDVKVCYFEGFDVRDVEGYVFFDFGLYSGGGG